MIILTTLEFSVVDGQKKDTVKVSYDPYSNPYTVSFNFPGNVPWVIGRELFKEALEKGRSGESDVQMVVDTDTLMLHLAGVKESIDLSFPLQQIDQLVQAMYRVVEDGAESQMVDWEAELAKLL